jgi:hypothetical protein
MDRAATVLAERTVTRLRPLLPTDMRGNPRVDDGCLINVVGGGHCYCLDQCFATMHRTAPDEAAAPMARPENSATRLRLRASTAENGERFGRSLHPTTRHWPITAHRLPKHLTADWRDVARVTPEDAAEFNSPCCRRALLRTTKPNQSDVHGTGAT